MSETMAQQSGHRGAQAQGDWNLWFRWVLANAIGEVVGLGAAAVVGVGLAWTGLSRRRWALPPALP